MKKLQRFDTSAIARRFVEGLPFVGIQAVPRATSVRLTIETPASAKRGASVVWFARTWRTARKQAEAVLSEIKYKPYASIRNGVVTVSLSPSQVDIVIRDFARLNGFLQIDVDAIEALIRREAEAWMQRMKKAGKLKFHNARYAQLRRQPRAEGEPGPPRYAVWIVQQFEAQIMEQLQRLDPERLQDAATCLRCAVGSY
jgi:hypothetical protein